MWMFARIGKNWGGEELPVRRVDKPLVGYRSWLVHPATSGYVLHSLHIDFTWDTTSDAACLVPTHKAGNPVPDPECLCGLYAQLPDHPLSEWVHMTRGRVFASGTVAMSGRIIRCDAGYKAARATIQSPVVVDVECSGFPGCTNDVEHIQPSTVRSLFFGLCEEHRLTEKVAEQIVAEYSAPPVIAADVFLREVCRQLAIRYPGVEFLSYSMNDL